MRSDLYTIAFTTIITIILGLGLSATADSLRERQILNEELDIKKNILSVLGYKQDTPWTNEEVQSLYDANINEIRIDEFGSVIYELDKNENLSYTIYQSSENNKVTGYAIPIAGKGLWGTMYGYLALESDLNTIIGLEFYKDKETPGLGAEINNPKWKKLWKGKEIYSTNGELAIQVIKGSVMTDDSGFNNKVDGLSGATITGNGVTNLLQFWLSDLGFQPFLNQLKNNKTLSMESGDV